MIYLLQNNKEYDYDVRAIALAFFEREKIKEVTEEEWKQYRDKKDGYRFEGQKYINQAMNELEKNYVDKFQEMIAKRLLEEYKNNK